MKTTMNKMNLMISFFIDCYCCGWIPSSSPPQQKKHQFKIITSMRSCRVPLEDYEFSRNERQRPMTTVASTRRTCFRDIAALASAVLFDMPVGGQDPSVLANAVEDQISTGSGRRSNNPEMRGNPAVTIMTTASSKKGDKGIDPTLRASYYYPTAKKRYIPRIQKVSREIVQVPTFIVQEDWSAVEEFVKIADDAILPLHLYQSSLDGQGLSMKNAYAVQMKVDANVYEQSFLVFKTAVSSRQTEMALKAIADMGFAIADYRQQGHINDDQDDENTIPSVDEMRRMTMRRPTAPFASK